jgi:putative copper export protein
MTAISLKDANGKELPLAMARMDPTDALMISVGVAQPLSPGRYSVTWRTAASDGHPSHGTFSFVVLEGAGLPAIGPSSRLTDTIGSSHVATPPSVKSENAEDADAASSVGNSLARAFSFVGLLVLIGATMFRTLVLSRASGISADMRERMERRAALLGVFASVVVILSAFARLFLESEMMSEMHGMQTMSMTDMAMHTQWGFALRLELGAALLSLISFGLAMKRLRGAWLAASISSIVLAVTPALAGHAASSPKFISLMIATDFLHVLGGASWLGSLVAVIVVGLPLSLALGGAERWSSVASLVNSFSPVAMVSVALVVVSGVIASWVHLERLSALWQTTYGQVLLVKLALAVLTLTIGAYNFRRVQPQLVNEVGVTRLKRSATLELGFGFLVLLVTGFLTGISP